MGYTAFVLGEPPGVTWRDHYNPHTGAIFYHSRPHSDRTSISSGPGSGRTVERECIRPSDLHRLGNDGIGDVDPLVAVPQNPRSDRTSSQSSGAQGSGKGRKAKLTAEHDEAVPVRQRTPGREPSYFQPSAIQVGFPSVVGGVQN